MGTTSTSSTPASAAAKHASHQNIAEEEFWRKPPVIQKLKLDYTADLSITEVVRMQKRRIEEYSRIAGEKTLLRLLDDAKVKVKGLVANAKAGSFHEARLLSAQAQIEEVILETAKRANSSFGLVSRDLVGHSVNDVIQQVKAAEVMYGGVTRVIPMKEALSFVQKTESRRSVLRRYKRSIASWGNSLTNDIERTLSLSLLTGEGVDQGIDAIAACDDTFKDARWKAERIWRTETADVYESSKLDTAEYLNNEEGLELKKQLTAIIDYRTGEDSIYVNGQVRELKKPFNDGKKDYMNPPNRPNDRETVTYLEEEWLEEEQEKLEADLKQDDGKYKYTNNLVKKLNPDQYLKDYKGKMPNKGALKKIRKVEQEIVNMPIERGVILDYKGNIQFQKDGTVSGIKFTPGEMKYFKGNIVTHNHPGQAKYKYAKMSFSPADIKAACTGQAKEIRVVAGKKLYIMKPPDGKMWNEKYYKNAIKPVMQEHANKIQMDSMLLPDYESKQYYEEFNHTMWERVASDLGLRYTKFEL